MTFVIIGHERGIPSKCGSSARADYVPALDLQGAKSGFEKKLLVDDPLAGNTVKLRENPKALSTKLNSKEFNGQANDLGYGKNLKDIIVGNSQPSSKSFLIGYECCSTTKWQWAFSEKCLRYSLNLCESRAFWEKGQ